MKRLIQKELYLIITALTVDASCHNTHNENINTISSPNYPRSYPNSKHCTWNVTAPIGARIRVAHFSYSLESSSGCTYDDLKIYDGPSTRSGRLAKLCGTSSYRGITSTANNLFFVFNSDSSTRYKGFQITLSINGMKKNLSISKRTNLRNYIS